MTEQNTENEVFIQEENDVLLYQYNDGRKVYGRYSREGEKLAEITVKNGREIDYNTDVN